MSKVVKIITVIVIFLLLLCLFVILIRNGNVQLLNPQGYIAQIQSQLLWGALILATCIGFPVVGITLFVAFRYKDGNPKRKYSPNWTVGKPLVILWWLIPFLFISMLSVVIWITAHEVDPYKPIPSSVKPITIQVVALQWKWLFIYPQQHIATVNFIEFPVGTPINFQLTADAPMNSFWIPSLGGQIYAMAGMTTQLHFLADKQGDYPGGGAEMSGEGFAGMQFTARATSSNAFASWVQESQQSKNKLTLSAYDMLAKPSSYNPVAVYVLSDQNLYNNIMMKFMPPGQKMQMSGM